MAAESTEASARRAGILDAAGRVFLRYGFKKTSMDDLAKAAGLSRQGLYLHFPTKEDLFKAALLSLSESMGSASRAALARDDLPVEERLLGGFTVLHGAFIGEMAGEYLNELLETAATLVGPVVGEVEHDLVNGVARVLRSSGVAAAWKDEGISAKELAETLYATSSGAKHLVKTAAAYREQMRIAITLVCTKRSTQKHTITKA